MTIHYVLYEISKETVIAFSKAYKNLGYIISASLAQHTPENGPTHIHVIVQYPRGTGQRDLFKDFQGCTMVDDIRCYESTWRLYLSQNGKTPIIDI